MVHQTRTPLTILQTHLEGIEDGIIDVNQKELTTCQNQISDITHIISNMSKLIDAGNEKEQLIIETFDLTTLLRQIEQGLSAQFKLKNIAFHVDTSKNLSITTDRYKLSQGIYNILTNAYKYTKENGTVTVSYRLLDNSLEIKIQDTGIGIEEKDLKSIFDAYYRGGHDNHQKGDGIGLFIVNKNIKSIGGYVDVKSKVNVGSEFVIHIPMDLK
jgi:signal transduction histidine kinase